MWRAPHRGFHNLSGTSLQSIRDAEVSAFSVFQQVQNGTHLAVGDEVAFIIGMNPKSGDRLARKLRRTKEAPASPPAEVVPERNPNAMKFTGNIKVTAPLCPSALTVVKAFGVLCLHVVANVHGKLRHALETHGLPQICDRHSSAGCEKLVVPGNQATSDCRRRGTLVSKPSLDMT